MRQLATLKVQVPKCEVLGKTIRTKSSIETLHALHLGTLDP